MNVGQLLWRLLRIAVRGGWRHDVYFVPEFLDPDVAAAVIDHVNGRDWQVKGIWVDPDPGGTPLVVAQLFLGRCST